MSRRDDERREASDERQEKKNLMERLFLFKKRILCLCTHVTRLGLFSLLSSLSFLLFRSRSRLAYSHPSRGLVAPAVARPVECSRVCG